MVSLKDPTHFFNHTQYLLKLEAKLSLQPIISKLLQHGFLFLLNPISTPLFYWFQKEKRCDLSLIQDMRIIEVVVPKHRVAPNPYILVGTIAPDTQWFTTLDLKYAFFCIYLSTQSQFILLLIGTPL